VALGGTTMPRPTLRHGVVRALFVETTGWGHRSRVVVGNIHPGYRGNKSKPQPHNSDWPAGGGDRRKPANGRSGRPARPKKQTFASYLL